MKLPPIHFAPISPIAAAFRAGLDTAPCTHPHGSQLRTAYLRGMLARLRREQQARELAETIAAMERLTGEKVA